MPHRLILIQALHVNNLARFTSFIVMPSLAHKTLQRALKRESSFLRLSVN